MSSFPKFKTPTENAATSATFATFQPKSSRSSKSSNPFAAQENERQATESEQDLILTPAEWYPHFREFHERVWTEHPVDWRLLRKNQLDLLRQIQGKEAQLDALGDARLSQAIGIMREWRQLMLQAELACTVMTRDEFQTRFGHSAPPWPTSEERCDVCGFYNVDTASGFCTNCEAKT